MRVAPLGNSTFDHASSAVSDLCVSTSENVMNSDFASVNGLSVSIILSVPVEPDGPVDEPQADATRQATARVKARANA